MDRNIPVGMGILSRYPIVEHSSFKLADQGLVYRLRVVVDVDERRVAIYDIHTTFPWFRPKPAPLLGGLSLPTYDDDTRHAEIQRLVKTLKAERYPVMLAGDFNLSDQSSDYQALLEVGLTRHLPQRGLWTGAHLAGQSNTLS